MIPRRQRRHHHHYNHRRHLMNGIRSRIEREKSPYRLIWLYTFLFDAGELPA